MAVRIMTTEDAERAREFYRIHRSHVNKMLKEHGPQVMPTGSDVARPELWKAMHWRWFMVGEVAK